jgi:hypothetical protein
MGFATYASGPLFQTYAGAGYAAMSLIAAVSLAAALFIRARWQGSTI